MQSVKTETILRAGIGLLVVALVFVIYAGIHERIVVAGDTAPEFTITADNGRTVSVPSFGGKLLVLNFWATWCPPCIQETPSLSRFAQGARNGIPFNPGLRSNSAISEYGKYKMFFPCTFISYARFPIDGMIDTSTPRAASVKRITAIPRSEVRLAA